MSVRNSLRIALVISALTLLAACSSTPEEEAGKALYQALTALDTGDTDTYLRLTDGYDEADSLHKEAYRLVAIQRHALDTAQHGQGERHTTITRMEMDGDSAATAFYVSHFANGDSLCAMQQMVLREKQWKLSHSL